MQVAVQPYMQGEFQGSHHVFTGEVLKAQIRGNAFVNNCGLQSQK